MLRFFNVFIQYVSGHETFKFVLVLVLIRFYKKKKFGTGYDSGSKNYRNKFWLWYRRTPVFRDKFFFSKSKKKSSINMKYILSKMIKPNYSSIIALKVCKFTILIII